MKSRARRTRALISAILILALISILSTTCKDPTNTSGGGNNNGLPGGGNNGGGLPGGGGGGGGNGGLPNTPTGETRLVISIHDSQFNHSSQARAANKEETRNIQALNLTVREMNISGPGGGWLTIMDEPRTIDIIAASRGEPVILSDVSIEPGTYKELRLVLSGGSTIKVDGEEFPLRVPSGEQSGLKLKGPFEIPQGKLFTLVIDLNTAKSVNWNQGQGWRLQPVISISNGAEVLGIFRGNLTVADSLGACETLLQLYADNTARLRIADYPNYTLSGDYSYNSATKNIVLSDFSLSAPGLRKRAMKQVMKKIPETITLPVKQWSLDSIIAVDISGLTCNLYRVDSFDFSAGVSFTEFTLNIDYPDASKIGKDVITEIRFIDTGMPPITLLGEFDGSRITETVTVLNSYIQGNSTRVRVTSYLFEDAENLNIEIGEYASIWAVYMVDSVFSETTDNSWQNPDVFTLIREGENQEFTVSFKPRLNIKMHHENFTDNNPVITWDDYQEADNGYFVLVLAEDKYNNNGDSSFAAAYSTFSREPRVRVISDRIKFTTTYTTAHEIPPSIAVGDVIRIEVFVLDGSGTLDTLYKQGALLMDSVMIVR